MQIAASTRRLIRKGTNLVPNGKGATIKLFYLLINDKKEN
jgi:hypothetical protein